MLSSYFIVGQKYEYFGLTIPQNKKREQHSCSLSYGHLLCLQNSTSNCTGNVLFYST